MRYVVARFSKEQCEMAYRIYATDALKLIAENTAHFAGGNFPQSRYADVISRKRTKYDNMSAEEIAAEIIKGADLVVK